MLNGVITIFHILAALGIILVVLLQSGKGGDLAGVFGAGGGEGFFGGRGPGSFLSRLTTGIAILFILTSLFLSVIPSLRRPSSIIQREVVEDQVAPTSETGDAPSAAEGGGNIGSSTQGEE